MKPLSIIGFACLLTALAACGGSGANTPEAALQTVLDAARAGNAAAFREGFPSREEIAALFECPPGVDLVPRYDGLSDEFVAWRDTRPVLAPGALTIAASSAIRAGGAVGGCTARRAMNLVRADVRLDGSNGEQRYAMRFVEADGRYRVLGF